MELAKDIEKKVREIPEDIEIVAATKYVEAEDMCKLFTLEFIPLVKIVRMLY